MLDEFISTAVFSELARFFASGLKSHNSDAGPATVFIN